MELLTVEEFAERMKISRTTVFDWIRKGTLKAGRHYLKIGRVIRFEWGHELVHKLHEDCVEEPQERVSGKPRLNKNRRPDNRRISIDLDY